MSRIVPDAQFVDEAVANLDAMDARLARFGPGADAQGVHAVFRHAHSVKGGAAAFGLDALAELMHLVESVLDGSRKSDALPDPSTTGLLREAVYAARQMLLDGGDADVMSTQDLAMQLRERAQVPEASAGARWRRITIRTHEAHAVSAAVTGLFSDIADLGELLSVRRGDGDEQVFEVRTVVGDDELLDLLAMHVERRNVAISAVLDSPTNARSQRVNQALVADTAVATVRVPAAQLRRLVQRARRLTDGGQPPLRRAARTATVSAAPDAMPAAADFGTWQSDVIALCRDLEQLASAPASTLFERVAPMLRRLSVRLHKQIEFAVRGGEVRVDRAVLQRLADPLMHLVRNACDHGIEAPEQRVLAGKSATGRIEVSAWREAGGIRISVRDDGAGLSRDNLLQAARALAIALPSSLDDKDVWQLVFAPGLSTTASISDVSGRGVGMDAVRRQIVDLKGEVSIMSAAGKGVCVTLSIPDDDIGQDPAFGPDAVG